MEKKIIDSEAFKEAIIPLENLIGRKLTPVEFKNIYYTVASSPTDNDFNFIIYKYSRYYGVTVTDIEQSLIIDLFKRHSLSHIDLERAFKLRIQTVISKARIFPTPAELLIMIKPEAIINIYDSNEMDKVSNSTEDIRLIAKQDISKLVKKLFTKV